MNRRCTNVLDEVRREIEGFLAGLARDQMLPGGRRRLLDVGCWDGEFTAHWAAMLEAEALGIEVFSGPAAEARERGIGVAEIDLETARFPWPDASIDVVIANQVLEHLKNVLLPMAEIYRVLRPGGTVIVSVPNLASLHNRVLLAFGAQPTSIRTLGPHVRAFTHREIRDLVALGNVLDIERAIGVGFYPFPAPVARLATWFWPGGSHTSLIVARKRSALGAATAGGAGTNPWRDAMTQHDAKEFQTFYR